MLLCAPLLLFHDCPFRAVVITSSDFFCHRNIWFCHCNRYGNTSHISCKFLYLPLLSNSWLIWGMDTCLGQHKGFVRDCRYHTFNLLQVITSCWNYGSCHRLFLNYEMNPTACSFINVIADIIIYIFRISNINGELTECHDLKWQAERFVFDVKNAIEHMSKAAAFM